MRYLYQTEWQKIKFISFAKISSVKLADRTFYNNFYSLFFSKYYFYTDLDKSWLESKEIIAKWLSILIEDKNAILSVGCGIGFIEYCLKNIFGNKLNLYVYDYADLAHKWLKTFVSKNRIFVSSNKLPSIKFNLIYLSAVDYSLNDADLILLLRLLKKRLNKKGMIVLISASFIEKNNFFSYIKNLIKYFLLRFYICFFDRNKFQLWGFMRDRKEYLRLMNKVKFKYVTDGFEFQGRHSFYWISGKVD